MVNIELLKKEIIKVRGSTSSSLRRKDEEKN
jgi:hypothetical protein